MEAMEHNTAEDIFKYLPAEEMINAKLINIVIGTRVQDACNIRYQYIFFLYEKTASVHKCDARSNEVRQRTRTIKRYRTGWLC